MRRRRGSAACIFLLVTSVMVAGCTPDGGTSVTVRDSAGVRVVENGHVEVGPECRLSPEPRLDLGVADGPDEFEFYRVTDATRFPDGRLAVINRGSQELRLFRSDGTFLRAVGGPGEG